MCVADEKTWRKIEAEYIAGDASYRSLAAKYGVHYSVICQHAKAGGWQTKRKQAANKAAAKAIEKIAERRATAMAETAALTDQARGIAEAVTRALHGSPELLAADTSQLRAYMAALKDLLALERDVFGIPDEAQKLRREQFELEKQRYADEKAAAAKEKETGQILRIIAPDEEALDE